MASTNLALGYLGPEGSHSHAAVGRLMAHAAVAGWLLTPTPVPNLRRLITDVTEGAMPLALLPVENALEGSVAESLYGLLVDQPHPPRILAELALPIRHCLIVANPETTTITDIISHPQALAQCQTTCQTRVQAQYGQGDLPMAIHAATSTSEAVASLANRPKGWAAIGTAAAAQQYGAHVLADNISDVATNQTRFWLVASPHTELPDFSGHYPQKTSLCMGLNDRPGVLVDVLLVLKAYGLTMTRIESRPARRQLGDYLFFIDVAANLRDAEHERVRMYLEADSAYCAMSSAYAVLGLLP